MRATEPKRHRGMVKENRRGREERGERKRRGGEADPSSL